MKQTTMLEKNVPSHKKTYKPNAKTLKLWQALKAVIEPYDVISVRGVYYQAEMAGIVGKTEADYNKVQRALVQMRRHGYLPYEKVQDNSRERRGVFAHNGIESALQHTRELYRRNYWLDQPMRVEVWCEKDALSPVLIPICDRYGVVFAALRGFDSDSFSYVSAQDIIRYRKPTKVIYFGDHDPSGWWIARNLEGTLQGFGADATVEHIGVHPWQIEQWNLPTRKGKSSDNRLPGFVRHFGSDRCTEVDAIPPDKLQSMASDAIMSVIDWQQWAKIERTERLERETYDNIIRALPLIHKQTQDAHSKRVPYDKEQQT